MYVLMITPNKYPEGDAGAVRDNSFAKIYQELGYRVIHIGMGEKAYRGNFDGVEYFSLYVNNEGIGRKIHNNLTYVKRLNSVFERVKNIWGNPGAIHIYDIPHKAINWVINVSKVYNCPIIHDSVEWYSACEFKLKQFAYPYILKNLTNMYYIRKPIKVIAISSYLENYFRAKGLTTKRIPVIMNSDMISERPMVRKGKIKLVYAGAPASKDYLSECIRAFCRLDDETRACFEFRIIGVDRKYVEDICNTPICSEIFVLGRVDRKTVLKNLQECDFALLLRPSNERYTKAGFPTKVVEAMMNGCAMVCNYTSDLSLYLQDKKNSIIVEKCDISCMERVLKTISTMSDDEILKIRKNAVNTARECFDYHKYINIVEALLAEQNV